MDFGPAGDTSGIWECSDLLQVPVKEKPGSSKWILLNSVATTMQYFIGEFDGHIFRSENENGEILRPDYGADFYAGITYNNLPAAMAPVLIGWVNNWSYAGAIPTSPWRGSMSVPRSLYVTQVNGKWQLLQKPVETLKNYRQQHTGYKNIQVTGYKKLPVQTQQSEIELIITPGKEDSCGIQLAVGNGKQFTIGYSEAQQQLYTDRASSGDSAFHPAFKKWLKSAIQVNEKNGQLKLHILFDKSIIEIFAGEGEAVITNQLFPANENMGIMLFSKNGKTVFDNVQIWLLKSAW